MIALGSDHGGYDLKKEIIKYLTENKYEIKDFGCFDNQPVDYPQYAFNVADAIVRGECEKGILICGTGIGMSIAANKIHGIRAAVCTDTYMARMSREHNDANILALGERVIGKGLALDIVAVWLKSEFLGGMHKNRVTQITMKEL
jgi:ribose 5-phosphate isomerase B